MLNEMMIKGIVKKALLEDVGTGDITTISTVPEDKQITGSFLAKESGILCGMDVVAAVFGEIDPEVSIITAHKDGDTLEKGMVFAKVKGSARSILMGERVALNFLQRMSGIATYANRLQSDITEDGYKTKILDTRKTTPGLRVLEKYAVRVGGAYNHRYNLSDGVLIKDNHIEASGGITAAVRNAREIIPHTLKIEVEVKNFDEVNEALEAGADILMLDNMTIEQMAEAVKMIDGRAQVEASGNMDQKPLREVAATGVDFISLGALTHSVKALDISLKF
jgi:nicotinate-nucleotide pyrophosphorylase (carboxylating)